MTAPSFQNDDGLAHRLQQWLHDSPAFGRTVELVDLQPLGGGQSSDMMRFSTYQEGVEASFVLRREPRAKQLFLKPDVIREFAIIQGVANAGTVPVAPLIAAEPDEAILDAPFFVMREVAGFVPLGRPSMHVAGPLPSLGAGLRGKLWDGAMRALVGIHALDWRRTHPFLARELGEANPLLAHLDRLSQWYAWTVKGRAFPITDQALAYLKAEAGHHTREPAVLLWGDARVGNILFTPDADVAAVLDWEGAIVGPAGLDLGYWMMMDDFQAESIGVQRLEGWPDETSTLARYAALSGYAPPDISYFIIMAAFFIATTLIRQADLGVAAGRLPADTGMGHQNSATQIIARRLNLAVPDLSPDFIRHRRLDLLTGRHA